MQRILLKSKIHRVRITDANIDYEGSVSIDEKLMEKANIIPYERVNIWDVNNGNRFETYAIPAKKNSGDIVVNGAAARLVQIGDTIIIASFAIYSGEEIRPSKKGGEGYKPVMVYVDNNNRVTSVK